jgi:UDP-N-acetyl-D-mannosaminuronic acid transferase (WecB/TagA/CpsF family)
LCLLEHLARARKRGSMTVEPRKRRPEVWVLMAVVWVYMLLSQPWTRVVALVIAGTAVIAGLAIWIAKKNAGPNE